jgi:hypothetical protein
MASAVIIILVPSLNVYFNMEPVESFSRHITP